MGIKEEYKSLEQNISNVRENLEDLVRNAEVSGSYEVSSEISGLEKKLFYLERRHSDLKKQLAAEIVSYEGAERAFDRAHRDTNRSNDGSSGSNQYRKKLYAGKRAAQQEKASLEALLNSAPNAYAATPLGGIVDYFDSSSSLAPGAATANFDEQMAGVKASIPDTASSSQGSAYLPIKDYFTGKQPASSLDELTNISPSNYTDHLDSSKYLLAAMTQPASNLDELTSISPGNYLSSVMDTAPGQYPPAADSSLNWQGWQKDAHQYYHYLPKLLEPVKDIVYPVGKMVTGFVEGIFKLEYLNPYNWFKGK